MNQQHIIPPEALEKLAELIAQKIRCPTPEKIERVLPEQAAKELGVSRVDIYYGLIHHEFPFGFAKREEGKINHSYFIFRPLLDAYKRGELFGLEERLCVIREKYERQTNF